MLSHELLVRKLQPKVGEQVVLFLVSLEYQVVVLIVLGKPLLVICAEEVVCSPLTKSGEDGTLKSAVDNEDTQPFLLWLLLLLRRW